MSGRELRVLHIAANYPDNVFSQPTTKAVQNLVNATTPNLKHFVVSVARVYPFAKLKKVRSGGTLSIAYRGLPLAIGARYFFARLARQIAEELRDELGSFDVIHAHKLSVEGVVAWHLSMRFGIPLLTTVRGFTDVRILKARPDLRRVYAGILNHSSAVILPAPWLKEALKSFNGLDFEDLERSKKLFVMPNIIEASDTLLSGIRSSGASSGRICTIFRDGQGRKKGFFKILKAISQANSGLNDLELDVIGCSNNSIEARHVQSCGLNSRVRFLGRIPHAEVQKKLQEYDAFVLPSASETFGMSLIEAIISGVPIMYSAKAGVDGYFDDMTVGVRVDPKSQASVTAGLVQLIRDCSEYKEAIRYLYSHKRFDNFSADAIAEVYCKALGRANEHSRVSSKNCGGRNGNS